jgi:hypothetical protein
MPPIATVFTPPKFLPLIVIAPPIAALDGVNDVIIGAGIKVKPDRFPLPPGAETATLPLAPVPIIAVICVGERTE